MLLLAFVTTRGQCCASQDSGLQNAKDFLHHPLDGLLPEEPVRGTAQQGLLNGQSSLAFILCSAVSVVPFPNVKLPLII